ncbi:MAG: M23 family metallopeptidase [Deltaproteobacteria bacterium]|nr:M23 family metallopeptidase [Deltaproteobacteria bacterium]
MKLPCAVIVVLIAMTDTIPVFAQGSPEQSAETGKGRTTGAALDPVTRCAIGRWRTCDIKQAVARGLFETGLRPSFPENAKCRDIDEGYAISYAQKRNREAYHGGIDMPAPWGTPMIAAAAGTVVGKYLGENSARGIEIVLRHSPEDTGIPLWIYTQYAHFSEMPTLKIGQRVRMGENLGPTGNSGIDPRRGTQSTKRRPAIHFAVFYSTGELYADIRDTIIPVEGRWMDPVALFRKKLPLDSDSMKALPEEEKQVPISIMFDDGETFPADTKIIWPYTCARR